LRITALTTGWSVNEKKTLAIVSDGPYHRLFVNDANALGGRYLQVNNFDNGYVGLYAVGPVNFQNPTLQTKTRVTVSLSKCMTVEQYKASLKITLGLSDFQIENMVYTLNCTTAKRSLSGAVGTVSFDIVGSPGASSTAITSELAAKVASSHASILENFEALSEPIIQSTAPLASEIIGIATIAVIASTLPFIIAGAVAGAIALAGITTGVYFAVKKAKKDDEPIPYKPTPPPEEPKVVFQEPEPEPEPVPKKYKPKGATVDIFNLDPNDPQSITARAPAIKRNN